MGEERKARRRQDLSVSVLKRFQEIGNATGTWGVLGLSLILNELLVCLLASQTKELVCLNSHVEVCDNLLQAEFGKRDRRNFAINVSGMYSTKHAQRVHNKEWNGCRMTPIQMCQMWQMRANADAATATTIFQ